MLSGVFLFITFSTWLVGEVTQVSSPVIPGQQLSAEGLLSRFLEQKEPLMGCLDHLPTPWTITTTMLHYLVTDPTWTILMNKDRRARIKNPLRLHAVSRISPPKRGYCYLKWGRKMDWVNLIFSILRERFLIIRSFSADKGPADPWCWFWQPQVCCSLASYSSSVNLSFIICKIKMPTPLQGCCEKERTCT